MSGQHTHGAGRGANARRLIIALALTSIFLVVEVLGGILADSLALISDAAHMFTDAAGLAIALVAIQIAKRPSDRKRTFGYYRFEILAAAFNAVLLFLVAIYILVEAYERFRSPPEVQSVAMLVVAGVGLLVNFAGLRLLTQGKDQSLNVKGAYLEVWSDFLSSIGVIAAAIAIKLTGWNWIDPLVAVAIGLWVLPRTWTLLKESLNILLQGVPGDLRLEEIETAVRAIPGVRELHNLHVWALTSGRNILSTHIVTDGDAASFINLQRQIETMLHDRFEITHTTIQVEDGQGHGHALREGGPQVT